LKPYLTTFIVIVDQKRIGKKHTKSNKLVFFQISFVSGAEITIFYSCRRDKTDM